MPIPKLNPVLLLLIILHFLVLIPLYSFSLTNYSNPNPTTRGLRLKLTHIDSPNSPLYQPELTDEERADRFFGISESKMAYAANNSQYYKPNVFTRLINEGKVYYVEVGIGKFNNMPYHRNFLLLDTGSSYIWTQCESCRVCFEQRYPRFPNTRSRTYKPYPCGRECDSQCAQDHCTKELTYGDGTHMKGVYARDAFTFSQGAVSKIKFVCAQEITHFKAAMPPGNTVTGILGMDRSKYSLISQLGVFNQYRFSFCLVDSRASVDTFLSFGDYVVPLPYMYTIPILGDGLIDYYVGLQDISVNGERLHLNPELFGLNSDNSGGTIVDNGNGIGQLVPSAFDSVTESVESYIIANNRYLRKSSDSNRWGLEFCWEPTHRGDPPMYFPTLTYHFQDDAEMHLTHDRVISKLPPINTHRRGLFCFMMFRSDTGINYIGGFQLVNQQVIIDLQTRPPTFSFTYTTCSDNTQG